MKISALLLSVCLAFATMSSGCAAFISKLPVVMAAVTDGMLVVDSIEAFANVYFAGHPDPTKQAQLAGLIAKTRTALDAALRIVNASKDLNQAKVDEAFAEMRAAYTELIALAESIGVKSSGATFKAAPGVLIVPEPLALTLKI
jgi:hypothetical protein